MAQKKKKKQEPKNHVEPLDQKLTYYLQSRQHNKIELPQRTFGIDLYKRVESKEMLWKIFRSDIPPMQDCYLSLGQAKSRNGQP